MPLLKTEIVSNNHLKLISSLALCSLILAGCNNAVVKKAPPFSHIHIGHTLTGWRATPGKKGLLETAEQEADRVLGSALKATNSNTLSAKKKHMSDALHAVDPRMQANGSGKGYGLTRSLTESIAHLEYAADSDDASMNIKKNVPIIAKKAQHLAKASSQLEIYGQAAINAFTLNEINAITEQFVSTAKQIISGGKLTRQYSLQQFRIDIESMAASEKPEYTTVDKYYLFNLIQLPGGKWGFSSKSKPRKHGYGSY